MASVVWSWFYFEVVFSEPHVGFPQISKCQGNLKICLGGTLCSLLTTRDEHLNKSGVFAASSVFQNHLGVLSTAQEEVLGLKADGIRFIFRDISDVNTALVEASTACCIKQNILRQNTKSIPSQIPGQSFIPGALSHMWSVCSLTAECPKPQNKPWISQDSCNGF